MTNLDMVRERIEILLTREESRLRSKENEDIRDLLFGKYWALSEVLSEVLGLIESERGFDEAQDLQKRAD